MATKKRRKVKKASPKTRVRTVVKTVVKRIRAKAAKVKRRFRRRRVARTDIRTVTRRRGSVASRGMGSNKKELLISAGFVGAGFLAGMAVSNLAPLPSVIKDSKYKGLLFVALGILGAVKMKNKRGQMACIGLASYGAVSTAKAFVPQLAALGSVDAGRITYTERSERARAVGRTDAQRAVGRGVIVTPDFA